MEKILIVDDEKHMRLILSKILSDEGYITFQAEDGHKAMIEVKKNNPDLVLLDYKLPDLNGDRILKQIKDHDNSIIVIMLTAFGDIKKAVVSMKLGAYDYLTKPFNNDEILLVISKALQTLNLKKEVTILKQKISKEQSKNKVIGETKEMKKVLELVDLVAPNDITVFLEGETGTGKELIANLIHKQSLRKDNPFVAVDCGAIPENLFESEMFGHEKGAFTGAVSTRIGKFEQANGGTLFLDEIGNLPFEMQAKFLRIIQEKRIIRVGSKNDIAVDVRIIAASNKNIVQDVEEGKFRSDLFYRIHEFKITLPVLNDRKDDIPLLANHFLKEYNSHFKKEIKGFSVKAINSLLDHNWQGNIRELKNVLKRAILLSKKEYIEPEHLIFTLVKNTKQNSFQNELSFENVNRETLDKKILIIKEAIRKADGNKSKAAETLGITRNQLYRILHRYSD